MDKEIGVTTDGRGEMSVEIEVKTVVDKVFGIVGIDGHVLCLLKIC